MSMPITKADPNGDAVAVALAVVVADEDANTDAISWQGEVVLLASAGRRYHPPDALRHVTIVPARSGRPASTGGTQ
jgi:hypothetical protein